ncbi:hypothetical protein P5Q53_004254 [Salmonella enterica]|nr:hypothetical protein [Salmonella enterica]
MPKFPKKIIEPKSYPINNTTLLSSIGLLFFGFTGFILIINAVGRLFASVWMYSIEDSGVVRAGAAFILTTVCFVLAVLCRKAFQFCLSKLKQHQIQN